MIQGSQALINDCFRFVTKFFEIINESAMHIYHSALPLSPRTSIVREKYERHALPLARIVHGLPTSWESSLADVEFPSEIRTAVWSPCSSLIAVVCGRPKATIEILDAVTLERLTGLQCPEGDLGGTTPRLVFSPGAHLLTWFGDSPGDIISWDPRTGVVTSTIPPEKHEHVLDLTSVAYSPCGTMFGGLFRNDNTFIISIYNARSGKRIASHSFDGTSLHEIWVEDRCLRFAATTSNSITTWEVGFAQTPPPAEVGSLYPLDNVRHFSFHPIPSLFAFISGRDVKVRDAQTSKFLLESSHDGWPRRVSISLDGSLLSYGTSGQEFYIWKKSPTGYTLHRKLASNTVNCGPLISPCGQSIIAYGGSTVQLWRTTDPTAPPSAIPSQTPQKIEEDLMVGFSPDEPLVAVARAGSRTITILELKSDGPEISRLTIDTGVKVHGVGVTGSAVVVIGDEHIITWKLSDRNDPIPRADRVRAVSFDHPPFPILAPRPTTSVSPDLRRAAIVEYGQAGSRLHLYDVNTGDCLASVPMVLKASPWFVPDKPDIWCVTDGGESDVWEIVKNEPAATNLEHRGSPARLPSGFPWRPSHGYSVTESRWVLNSSGKRLLWLPPNWRSGGWNRMWNKQHLVLLDRKLPDVVILELDE